MTLALCLKSILFRRKIHQSFANFKLDGNSKNKICILQCSHNMVEDFGKKFPEKKAENSGNIFFDSVNNSFSLYVLYLENFLRIYLNLVSPINELIIENYLSENGSKDSINVRRVKEKISKRVFDCVVDV